MGGFEDSVEHGAHLRAAAERAAQEKLVHQGFRDLGAGQCRAGYCVPWFAGDADVGDSATRRLPFSARTATTRSAQDAQGTIGGGTAFEDTYDAAGVVGLEPGGVQQRAGRVRPGARDTVVSGCAQEFRGLVPARAAPVGCSGPVRAGEAELTELVPQRVVAEGGRLVR